MNIKILAMTCALVLTTGVAMAQNNDNQNNETGAQVEGGAGVTGEGAKGDANVGANVGNTANIDANADGRISVAEFNARFQSLNEQEQGLMITGLTDEQLESLRDECKNDATISDMDRDFCDRLEAFNQ